MSIYRGIIFFVTGIPSLLFIFLTIFVGHEFNNWPAFLVAFIFLAVVNMFTVLGVVAGFKLSARPATFYYFELFFHTKLAFLAFIASILFFVLFYTGQSVFDSLVNFVRGSSNYYSYQNFFSDNLSNLNILQKAPAILAGIYLKAYFFYNTMHVLLISEKEARALIVKRAIFLLLLFAFYLSIAVARGTFFEVFECCFLVMFCFFLRNAFQLSKSNVKNFFYLSFGALIIVYLFYLNIELRGVVVHCIVENICLGGDESFSYQLLFILSGYFLWGLYFVGINVFYLANEGALFLFLGIQEFDSTVIRARLCSGDVKCGVTWHPDFSKLFSKFGILSFLVVFFHAAAAGVLLKVWSIGGSPFHLFFGFFMCLRIFSFFIGDFIFVSSSNTVFLLIGYLLAVLNVLHGSTRK